MDRAALDSGERQVAPTAAGIRRDHVARYTWAARRLQPHARVLDIACGCGYGTRILSDAGHVAVGADINAAAIAYARQHYRSFRTSFIQVDAMAPPAFAPMDACTVFETVEHLQQPAPLLTSLRRSSPLMFVSVPNESVFPWESLSAAARVFHARHYTCEDLHLLLDACGWYAAEIWGQRDAESEPEKGLITGRTLIAICQ